MIKRIKTGINSVFDTMDLKQLPDRMKQVVTDGGPQRPLLHPSTASLIQRCRLYSLTTMPQKQGQMDVNPLQVYRNSGPVAVMFVQIIV